MNKRIDNKRRVRALTLGALALLSDACERKECDDGTSTGRRFLEDTVQPNLCLTDQLRLSPERGDLFPASSEVLSSYPQLDGGSTVEPAMLLDATMDAGGASSATGRGWLRMVAIGVNDRGQAQEAAHVDIRLSTDDTRTVARLRPVNQDCELRSDAELRCRINVLGVAAFDLVHLNAGAGQAVVSAYSGTERDPTVARIEVRDGLHVTERALRIRGGASASDGIGSCQVSRQRTLAAACGRRQNATPLSLELFDRETGELLPWVVGQGRPPYAQVDATTLRGAGTSPGLLSLSKDCAEVREQLLVPFTAGDALSSPFFLCSSAAASTYSVRAVIRAADALSAERTLELPAVPQSIFVREVAVPSETDGGQATRLMFEVHDCESKPVSGRVLSFLPGDALVAERLLLDAIGTATTTGSVMRGGGRVALLDDTFTVLCESPLPAEGS